jgi:hypothetical protein
MKKEPEDRNKLKIASFRTTDGDWFDFSQMAESKGFTATDILKACMADYMGGIYSPVITTGIYAHVRTAQGITADEVQRLINEAVVNNGSITRDDVQSMIDEAVQLLQAAGLDSSTEDEDENEPEFDGWTIKEFSEANNLGVTRKDGAKAVNAALVTAGFDGEYFYKSSCGKIYPIEAR